MGQRVALPVGFAQRGYEVAAADDEHDLGVGPLPVLPLGGPSDGGEPVSHIRVVLQEGLGEPRLDPVGAGPREQTVSRAFPSRPPRSLDVPLRGPLDEIGEELDEALAPVLHPVLC